MGFDFSCRLGVVGVLAPKAEELFEVESLWNSDALGWGLTDKWMEWFIWGFNHYELN